MILERGKGGSLALVKQNSAKKVDTYRTILAERIRHIRKARKVSGPKLGEMVGLTRTAISRIEAGKSAPSLEVLCKIAIALDCTPDYLLGFRNTVVPSTSIDEMWPEAAARIRTAVKLLDYYEKEMLLAIIDTFLEQAERKKKRERRQ